MTEGLAVVQVVNQGRLVVISNRETRLEVEGFTTLASLPVTADDATLTDFSQKRIGRPQHGLKASGIK
jgi:hypothetical protein